VRSQFHHVIDIAPTIYQAVGIPAPKSVDGIEQKPLEGVSMNYSFDDANAPDTHKTQYFEMAGNRAIYHDGWFAGTVHKAPWEAKPRHPLNDDVWELYNVNEDFSQANNLADKYPEKLVELQKLFLDEAVKYHVLPIDDRTLERFDAAIAGRPDLMNGRTRLTLFEGTSGITENAFINIKNTSLSIVADVDVSAKASGVMICQGGDFGGWSFYIKDGKPTYTYNWLGLEQFTVSSKQKVTKGKHALKLDFAYDGGRGAGGIASIYMDNVKVGEGRIAKTESNVFSLDETADVGEDLNTPVVMSYKGKTKFTGRIEKVSVETFPAKK
jgi:arylsulfatase